MKNLVKVVFCLALTAAAVPMGFGRGDKIIPQVVDGPEWKTNFDITNISPEQATDRMWLVFYHKDGTRWNIQTNQGTNSEFRLALQPRQTLRVETSGGSQFGEGYAIIFDEENGNSDYSVDYVLGISVFYQYSTSSGIVDTVTVPVPQPTAVATVPVQMDDPDGIYSGFAFVNWAGTTNPVTIDLYPEEGGSSPSHTQTLTLAEDEQWTGFLDNLELFPGLKSFKGIAEITATGPVAFLGLLQTRAEAGQQYSTLVPVDKEALRRNSYIVLLQVSTDADPFMPLDIDNFTVDYFRNADAIEAYPWDLEYRYDGSDYTNRFLQPVNFAKLATLGIYPLPAGDDDFDAISLPYLKALTYSENNIDLSGTNLQVGFSFAVRTDIGNYAKARIVRIINTTVDSRLNKDIVLEVTVYK